MNTNAHPHLRYNPKAAALYAHLCLAVGAMLFAFAWFQKLKTALRHASRPGMVLFVAGIVLCCAVYLFCMTLYVAHVCAMRRDGTKSRALWIAAGVCALPCFSPFVLAHGSLRTRSRASFVCACVLLCELAAIAYEAVFDVPVVSVECYFTLFVCASVVAIYCMKDGLETGAGGLIPATATLTAYVILLRISMSAETARAVAESGMPRINLTVEEIANGYTNGVVVYDDSVRALEREIRALETPERIRDNRSIWQMNDDDVPVYDEFFATHSNLVERVNALTSRENLSFAHTNIVTDLSIVNMFLQTEIRDVTVFGNFCLSQLVRDAYTLNIPGVLAGNDRTQNIFRSFREPYIIVYYLYAHSVEMRRQDALQRVIPHVSDDVLTALKQQSVANITERRLWTQTLIEHTILKHNALIDAVGIHIPRDTNDFRTIATRHNFRSLLKGAWQSAERRFIADSFNEMLVAIHAVGTEADTDPRVNGRKYLDDDKFSPYSDNPLVVLSDTIVLHMFLPNLYREFAERGELFCVAVDVELYRRKYGALPETLDALVPEFMPRVPVSFATGEPFALEKGTLTQSISDNCDEDKTFEGFRITSRTPAVSYSVIDAIIDKPEK